MGNDGPSDLILLWPPGGDSEAHELLRRQNRETDVQINSAGLRMFENTYIYI